ncbi:MAG: hypothetical protein KY394_03025 [Actinobacteria bacterium]|nr:hypothetical protein [Actinomycetota bacterium]
MVALIVLGLVDLLPASALAALLLNFGHLPGSAPASGLGGGPSLKDLLRRRPGDEWYEMGDGESPGDWLDRVKDHWDDRLNPPLPPQAPVPPPTWKEQFKDWYTDKGGEFFDDIVDIVQDDIDRHRDARREADQQKRHSDQAHKQYPDSPHAPQ